MAATVYYRQVLTGGGSTALDEIAGATLSDGDIAFVMTGSAFYTYRVDASSGASESSPNVIAPDTPSASERWILQTVQNVQTLEYSNITTSTALAVAMTYNDSSGTNTHTLPLLSGTSAGETINLYITGTDRTVIINEHATDGGTEVWTGYAIGDHVTLVSNGTAWLVQDEYTTVKGVLALSADDAIAASSSEKIFDASYSEVDDIASWWDSSTGHDLTIGFDCQILINLEPLDTFASVGGFYSDYMSYYLDIDGTQHPAIAGNTTGGKGTSWLLDLTAGDVVEIYAKNHHSSSVLNVMGDASLDETRLSWQVMKRNR